MSTVSGLGARPGTLPQALPDPQRCLHQHSFRAEGAGSGAAAGMLVSSTLLSSGIALKKPNAVALAQNKPSSIQNVFDPQSSGPVYATAQI